MEITKEKLEYILEQRWWWWWQQGYCDDDVDDDKKSLLKSRAFAESYQH